MKEYAGVHSQLLRLKPILSQRYGVDRIGYFDCFLDQHHHQDCELNLLVILEKPLGWEFFELKEFLQKKLQTRIDICTPKALKPALRDHEPNPIRMRSFGRRFDYFLKDMQEAMMRILDYTRQSNYEEFETNLLMRDAVIRNFEIMGECVKHIPFSFQKKYKGIPWQHMLNLRNFIVHEYFDVDNEILWEIIQQDLNKNAQELNDIITHSNPSTFVTISKASRAQPPKPK